MYETMWYYSVMAKTKRKRKKGAGRPRLAKAKDPIRWNMRLDEATDQALVALAEHWECSCSEAARRAVKAAADNLKLV